MDKTNGSTQGTSGIATGDGKVVQVPDLVVPVNRIYNFVERSREAYFEQHSLDWCLDEIITRGMAEITRQIKTSDKRAEEKAAGSLLKEFNLTPKAAAELLKQLAAQQAQAAKVKAS